MKDEDIHLIGGQTLRIGDDEELQSIIQAFPYISYRSDFNEVGGFTSDSGWGCMIRVGQMMLAYTTMQIEKQEYITHVIITTINFIG